MFPGIDPKVDIAFKKVFGTEAWPNLTMSLINAVLQGGPLQPLTWLELLNPYTEKMAPDDKLSILDVKARDDQGRLFNIEMQMVANKSLPERILYYWSNLYSQQLMVGEDYHRLRPAISICFVNGTLFPGLAGYHRRFGLFDARYQLNFTDRLALHVIEIPNFDRELIDLRNPLDLWLYFFKNGIKLDADALPQPLDTGPLDTGAIRQAMEVLKMFSQSEMERELYEGRLKVERDRLTAEREMQETEQCRQETEQIRQETEQIRQEIEQIRQEIEQSRLEIEQMRQEAERDKEAAERERDETIRNASKLALVGQIQLSQRLLKRDVTDFAQLHERDESALRELADRLERELTRSP